MFITALLFFIGDNMKSNLKQKYLSSAFILLISTVIVKVISAVYKIPLTAYIGAEGRGYFSIAYNLCLPIHALTMGAFPIAVTRLVSSFNAKGDIDKVNALRFASKRLFLIVGTIGLFIMLLISKPYSAIISSSPKSIYTILALAPSVFFSCLCASHRSYCEGFLDMKATAISQLLEALFKMIFGLLFARYSMSYLYEEYLLDNTVLGSQMANEKQALSTIYPLTSAFAMLGVTLGSIAAYLFAKLYTDIKYSVNSCNRDMIKLAYDELITFSSALVGATVIQSLSNFVDTSSVQFILSRCSESNLLQKYTYSGTDIQTYIIGVYSSVLDFKNLVPSIVMTLGVVAVPAISTAYESDANRFNSLLSSIIKYSVSLSVLGGLVLCVFGKELLGIFYYSSNPDIVVNGSSLLFLMGATILPCSLATTTVYCVEALGFAKSCIPAFLTSCIVRTILNYFLMLTYKLDITGAVISNAVGFIIIVVMNIITIKKKTNARINVFKAIAKPVFCGTLTYFVMSYIKMNQALNLCKIIFLLILLIMIYLFMLIITKTLTINLDKKVKFGLNTCIFGTIIVLCI